MAKRTRNARDDSGLDDDEPHRTVPARPPKKVLRMDAVVIDSPPKRAKVKVSDHASF